MFYMDNYENHIVNCINTISDMYLSIPNITGIGLCKKECGGYKTCIPCLTFFVSKKLLPNQIPTKYILPKNIGSIITDVVETGDFYLNYSTNNNPIYARPAYGGLSCSNSFSSKNFYGSIGYAVTNIADESQLYFLSCSHVIANNYEKGGDMLSTVCQPASGYSNSEKIALLSRATPLIPNPKGDNKNTRRTFNQLDAAIAHIGLNNKENRKELLTKGIGTKKITIDGATVPKVDLKVWKIGSSMPDTKISGKVISINVNIDEVKVENTDLTFPFQNQCLAEIEYNPNDAGTLIITEKKSLAGLMSKNYAIGMCIGGSITKKLAVFTNIYTVLSELDIKFI